MRTLQQAIDKMRPDAALILRKHLSAVGINEWDDISTESICDFRDEVSETLAPGSAKVVLAYLKTILRRTEAIDNPEAYDKLLTVKGDNCRATYLTPEELAAFENVQTRGAKERIVQVESLIEAYTGARLSDVMTFDETNFHDGYLTYTSIKTHVSATVPCSEKTRGWIIYAQEHRADEPSLVARNRIIRRLAELAGIDTPVKTRRGGVESVTPKYEAISSHSFRRSFVTNLVESGASLNDAKICAGHTSVSMTERYCCINKPKLSSEAMAYIMQV